MVAIVSGCGAVIGYFMRGRAGTGDDQRHLDVFLQHRRGFPVAPLDWDVGAVEEEGDANASLSLLVNEPLVLAVGLIGQGHPSPNSDFHSLSLW